MMKKWPSKKLIGIAAIPIVALGVMTIALTHANAADSSTTATTIPAYCDTAMGGFSVQACESARASQLAQANITWPSTGSVMSGPAAEAKVNAGMGAQAAGMNAATGSPTVVSTYEFRTTYAGAGAYMEATNTLVASSTPVWVVTTTWSAPFPAAGMGLHPEPPPLNANQTTTIIDAISGNPIDSCTSCSVVQANGSLVKQDGAL